MGGGVGPSYEGSDDYRFLLGILIDGQYKGVQFRVRGPGLALDFIPKDSDQSTQFTAGPVFQVRLQRANGIEDNRVIRLGKINAAAELGAQVGIARRGVLQPFDRLSLEVQAVADVGNVHKSYVVTPTIRYLTPFGSSTLAMLHGGVEIVGKNYGQRYFGITAAGSAASGLGTYTIADAGIKNVNAGLLLRRAFGDDPMRGWSVFASGGYSRLLGRYARSPIVTDAGDSDQAVGLLGIAFSF